MRCRRSNVTAPGTSLGSTISGRINPEDSTIEDIARRLNEIRYQVERRQVQAIRRGEPDLADLETQLEREWRLLCLRAGFEDRAHRPPLPTSPRALLLSSAQVYQDMVIAHNRGTLISPRVAELQLTPISTPTNSSPLGPMPPHQRDSPESTTLRAVSPLVEADQHRVILGDPALPICIAEL